MKHSIYPFATIKSNPYDIKINSQTPYSDRNWPQIFSILWSTFYSFDKRKWWQHYERFHMAISFRFMPYAVHYMAWKRGIWTSPLSTKKLPYGLLHTPNLIYHTEHILYFLNNKHWWWHYEGLIMTLNFFHIWNTQYGIKKHAYEILTQTNWPLWWILKYLYGTKSSELQKVSILVSRIPDISGRKSGHFQIVTANLSIFP